MRLLPGKCDKETEKIWLGDLEAQNQTEMSHFAGGGRMAEKGRIAQSRGAPAVRAVGIYTPKVNEVRSRVR